jgi:hypothetical protein
MNKIETITINGKLVCTTKDVILERYKVERIESEGDICKAYRQGTLVYKIYMTTGAVVEYQS